MTRSTLRRLRWAATAILSRVARSATADFASFIAEFKASVSYTTTNHQPVKPEHLERNKPCRGASDGSYHLERPAPERRRRGRVHLSRAGPRLDVERHQPGSLSERMCPGSPRLTNSAESRSSTSSAVRGRMSPQELQKGEAELCGLGSRRSAWYHNASGAKRFGAHIE